MPTPSHPSRSAPKCVACAHYVERPLSRCDHPLTPMNLVTGSTGSLCETERSATGICGPAGTLFQTIQGAAA